MHEHAAEPAELVVTPQLRQAVYVHVDVAGYEQIDISIAVIVAPGRAEAQTTHCQACLVGHILELAVAQVAVKNVAAIACHVQIGQPVVVIVRNS